MEPSTPHMDCHFHYSLWGRKRRSGPALACALIVSAVSFLSQSGTVGAADVKAEAPDVSHPIFSVIVTRHGVRSISSTPPTYSWPKWDPVNFNDLTSHGYRLMTLMGAFYHKDALAQGIPFDCEHNGAFIYADKVQRTLETAYALIEGLCGSPDKLPVFREKDITVQDPIFNATEFSKKNIDSLQSERTVKAAAGDLSRIVVPDHEDDFAKLQQLLSTRCSPGPCERITSGESTIKCGEAKAVGMDDADNAGGECKAGGHVLAALKGPVATASTYAEDLFLEYAQCRRKDQMTSLDPATLQADLDAGMRLHVLAYRINARNALDPDVGRANAYNPFVRGSTLLVHIVAMLDLKAGSHVLDNVVTPNELNDKTLAIFSGHDTQLGALGGMLSAHWTPGGGIVPDDMPPGSALIFDLVPLQGGEFGVRLRFAAMRIDQFRKNERIDEKSIATTPVAFAGCAPAGCTASLKWFESLALKLEQTGWVELTQPCGYAGGCAPWPYVSEPTPPMLQALADPADWTEPECRR